MKAEFLEFRGSHGEIRLFAESVDDLWHLSHLIRPGDLVFATTLRSVETVQDKIRPEKPEKKPVRLGIRVEGVAFHPYANRLRISGVIQHGVDEGSHHTINLDAGTELSVIKTWRQLDLDRIQRAVKATSSGAVHILAVEEGEAELYRIRQYGPELVSTVTQGSSKGADTGGRGILFERVAQLLADVTGTVVIAGPGFVKDEAAKYLKEKIPDLSDRCITVETRRSGRGAVTEALGKGVLERITGDLQLKREAELLDSFLERMGKGGAIAYGKGEVEEAVSAGAAEQVLVIDEMVRNKTVADLLDRAEKIRAKVTVFSSLFDPGQQLAALGGIAAVLRYRMK
ncbi:MAG: mRNA surveillance protein pelota [Methanomicrobiales archaeon]|nr:mRNA surveillance protein pelota [Methanomicrobiales archaeon]MDD1668580.1 mRNA surveillance protein pelota [Methanomicrobiales archaeon]